MLYADFGSGLNRSFACYRVRGQLPRPCACPFLRLRRISSPRDPLASLSRNDTKRPKITQSRGQRRERIRGRELMRREEKKKDLDRTAASLLGGVCPELAVGSGSEHLDLASQGTAVRHDAPQANCSACSPRPRSGRTYDAANVVSGHFMQPCSVESERMATISGSRPQGRKGGGLDFPLFPRRRLFCAG